MMPRNAVTTEFVADEPLVVVLHHEEKIAGLLANTLSEKQLVVESYSVTELLQSAAIADRVAVAYKVIWVANTTHYLTTQSNLELVSHSLSPFQHKLSILLPIFTTFSEQVPGEIPGAQLAFQSQLEMVLFLNRHLPQAMFLFGQDILDHSVEYSAPQLLSQHLQKGLTYSPNIAIHPQTTFSFIQRVCRYFLQPQRSSVLIRGNSILATELCEEIRSLYQSYHFSPVEVQQVIVTPTAPIPFTVVENFVTDTITQALELFVQSVPSPKGHPQTFVWQQQLTQPDKQLGIEVQPQQSSQVPAYSQESILTSPEQSQNQLLATMAVSIQPSIPHTDNTTTDMSDLTTNTIKPEVIQGNAQEEVVPPSVEQPKPQPEKFDLNQEIQRVFSETHVTNKKKQTKRIEQKKSFVQKKTKKRTALFYGGLAFTGMGLGVLSLAIIFVVTANMFRSALSSFISTQVLAQESQNQVWDADKLSRVLRLQNLISLQVDSYSALVSLPALTEAQALVALSSQLPAVVEQKEVVNEGLKTFYLQLTGSESGDSVLTAEKMTIEALTAREKLSALEKELQSTMLLLDNNADQKEALEGFSRVIAEEKVAVQILQQLQPMLGKLLGQERKRTYAFILQNNQELRPTGGFIEDVALLTFQEGTLLSSKVFNGYQIDKQLSGSVIPPDDINTYLREADWNFIDSNWNPHFPKSAEQISWFLEKSLGTPIDGVITIDLYGVANILEATGPMDLPDYNEVLTDKNIFDQFEFHSEVSLVDNNKDYRQVVFDSLVAKITTLPPEKVGDLFKAFKQNLDDQHMLASFVEADELQTMKNLGWSGGLLQPNCPSQFETNNCFVDMVAQVEANVGTNTANHYLKRSIDHDVALNASSAAHVRTITLENTAQSDAWPKGPYQVFTRLYIPSNAQVGSVQIAGEALSKSDLIVREENNRKIVGFYVEVPIKSSKKIVVSYAVPFAQPLSDSFAYTFFEQQQPGSGPTPFFLKIHSPENYSPTIIAPQADVADGIIRFSKDRIGHGFFGASFQK